MEQKITKKQQLQFLLKITRLLKLNDSFKIPIDINNLKGSNLLLQKRIRDRHAKKAIIGIN